MEFPYKISPYMQAKLMQRVFPELTECAGLDMEGELPVGVESTNRLPSNRIVMGVGPAESQLFSEDDLDG